MGDRVRAAQAAAAEEAKNNAAYTTSARLPSFNANMQVPQNSWGYDAQGNPVFQVPGFLNSAPPAAAPQTLADIAATMQGIPKNPAFEKFHNEFKNEKQSTLQSLLAMLSPSYSGGKPMSPDPTFRMRQTNDALLARLNAIAPGAYPMGYGSDPVPAGGVSGNLADVVGINNPMVPFWGRARGQ
jgi:hypothetical protein